MAGSQARYEIAIRRGHSYSWDQLWPDAIREFEQASQEAPSEPSPYAGLGMAYFELGELENSLENYKLAARFSKGDMIYLKHVADVQERLGQVRDAAQTYMAIGEIQLRRKRLDEAVGNWLRAARLDPNLIGARRRLASLYQRQGLTRNAVREYLALARIYNSQNQKESALKMCQAALELDPRNPDILTAMELIEQGAADIATDDEIFVSLETLAAFDSEEIPPFATAYEAETAGGPVKDDSVISGGPMQHARRLALEQLAQGVFEFEDEEDALMATTGIGINKVERDAYISEGLDYQTRDRFEEAIASFEQAIRGGENSAAVHFNLGVLYQDQVRLDDAISQFNQANEEQRYRVASNYALGETYRELEAVSKAVEHYLVALTIIDLNTVQPEQSDRLIELYDHLANDLLTGEDTAKATEFMAALVEFFEHKDWEFKIRAARERLDALSADGQTMILGDILMAGSTQVLESLYLSELYGKRGNYHSAVEEAYRAIQLSPFYLPGHIQLAELLARWERADIAVAKFIAIGDTYRVRGDENGSINAYERALELSPLDLKTRARLIELLIQSDRLERALEHYLALGDAQYNLAQVDEARKTYMEALKIVPSGELGTEWRLRLLRVIADIDMQRLDWKRAIAAYSELSKSDPGDVMIARSMIDLYQKVGRPDAGMRHLDRHLVYLVRNGRGDEITGILAEMIEQQPADAGLVDRMVRLQIHQGQNAEAIELLDQLGELQLEAGDTEGAIATIEKILTLHPEDELKYSQLLYSMRQGSGTGTSEADHLPVA
ncbi:MAG: tetratricopeptide repeat protein [Candidatus Promineifilaceae bacterium]